MLIPIKMPKMAANMERGLISKWLKNEGDMVNKGEPLFEIMTDKAIFEIESPSMGTLNIKTPKGGTALVEDIVGTLILNACPLKETLLIIGTGKGSQIVKDILGNQYYYLTRDILPTEVDKLKDEIFDYIIISFTKDMDARRKIFEECKNRGCKFINVIHSKALIENNTQIGEGNLIYAYSRIGPFSKVGNNNVISAFTNIEHHNEIGSHILFGPHCSTSGTVKIGDSCKLGTGIFIQDNITIGDNVKIASGSIIINHIKPNSFVRQKYAI